MNGNAFLRNIVHPRLTCLLSPGILSQSRSVQKIVFPFPDRIELSMKKIVLRCRLLIHKGNVSSADTTCLLSEYEKSMQRNNSKV